MKLLHEEKTKQNKLTKKNPVLELHLSEPHSAEFWVSDHPVYGVQVTMECGV